MRIPQLLYPTAPDSKYVENNDNNTYDEPCEHDDLIIKGNQ